MKTCGKCHISKNDTEFAKSKNNSDGLHYWCRRCNFDYKKQHYKDNKEQILKNVKEYYDENREKKIEYQKQYQQENKEEIVEYNKQYREENKEEIAENSKIYRKNNKEKIAKIKSQYYEANKKELLEKAKRNIKKRRKNDPVFKLQNNISRSINRVLKSNGGSKAGKSSRKYLPFTEQQLNDHIESLFSHPDNLTSDGQVWMTWENHGVYRKEKWDDNDPTTWKWQLDHIKPHSNFKYKNMSCQEFIACWSLSNLRPLSAKQNNLDGDRREISNIEESKEKKNVK